MQFGQLIKYNMGNIYLEKFTQNARQKLLPDIFLNIKIEDISGSRV